MKKYFIIFILTILLNNTEIIRIVNQYRGLNHLPALKISKTLNQTAEYKVNDILKNTGFTHKNTAEIFKNFKLKNVYGENLAEGYISEKNLVDAWMASPTHRSNILDTDFTKIGSYNLNGIVALHFN